LTPRSSKNKGKKFQNETRDVFLEVFPTLERDDIISNPMGNPGEDLMLSPAARRLIPYQIECKSKATSQIHTYYEQAKEHGNHEPMVVVKKDRSIPLAIVSLEHFLKLLKEVNDVHSSKS
jgi:hypothetical protein